MKTLKIGLCGLGTVGAGTVELLRKNQAAVSGRAGTGLQVTHIGVRRDKPDVDIGAARVSRDIFAVAKDPEIDVLVELIGGTDTALELVLTAIEHGKHIVTANKALIAEHGNQIFSAARAKGVNVRYEAAVAGGIPIIKALREGLAANQIEWLAGIINGTGNFILTEMRDKGREFADVLAEAQALGYAEADPTFDVEGIDAAHKLVIMASLAFGMPLRFDAVYTEGIGSLTPQDVEYAEELGYRIKHLGIARRTDKGVELRVHPTLIPAQRLLAKVEGVMNAVMVEGDAVGPTLYYGAGAGALPTASAVVADLVDLARDLSAGQVPKVADMAFVDEAISDLNVLPMSEVVTANYLRLEVDDKPGVMSSVASVLCDKGISIEALIQKAPQQGQTTVPVIILTNEALEGSVDKAITELEALDTLYGEVTRIRVESLSA